MIPLPGSLRRVAVPLGVIDQLARDRTSRTSTPERGKTAQIGRCSGKAVGGGVFWRNNDAGVVLGRAHEVPAKLAREGLEDFGVDAVGELAQGLGDLLTARDSLDGLGRVPAGAADVGLPDGLAW